MCGRQAPGCGIYRAPGRRWMCGIPRVCSCPVGIARVTMTPAFVSPAEHVPVDPTGFVGPLAYGLKHRQGQLPPPSEYRPTAAPPRLGTSSWGESPELHAALQQQRDRAAVQQQQHNGGGGSGAHGMLPPRAAIVVGPGCTPRRRTEGDVAPRSPAMVVAAAAAMASGLRSPLATVAEGRSPLNTRYARATTDCAPQHRSPPTSARSPPPSAGSPPPSARSPVAAPAARPTVLASRAPAAAGEGLVGRAAGEDGPLMQQGGGVVPSPRMWL